MSIAENLDRARAAIAAAAGRVDREPDEIQLVAVSKIHPASAIREAYAAGQRHFGENYVQELLGKQEELADLPDIHWHFIGHLQRNKVRRIVDRVALVETVDSLRLLREVEKRAAALDITVDVLIQVHIGGEETKSGCDTEELSPILDACRASSALRARGLMVIPPWEIDAEDARRYFRELRVLRDQHGDARTLPELSMGMSHDFEEAIEEGATLVRVGTAIFGPRSR